MTFDNDEYDPFEWALPEEERAKVAVDFGPKMTFEEALAMLKGGGSPPADDVKTGNVGDDTSDNFFDDLLPSATGSTAAAALAPTPVIPSCNRVLPHRAWAIGDMVAYGEATILAAPPGLGKTTLASALAIDAAVSCARKLDFHIFGPPRRVAIICLEDDSTELERRFQAQMKHHGYTDADVAGRVSLFGKELFPNGLNMTRSPGRDVWEVDANGFEVLEACIKSVGAEIVVLDSMMTFFPGGLNDQGVMAAAVRRLRTMLANLKVGCLFIHHEKKGAGGMGLDAVFGSTAIAAQVRAVFQLERPDKATLKEWGFLPEEAWKIFRPVVGKANATTGGARGWLQLCSVDLGNSEPPVYQHGDSVQALSKFTPPAPASAVSSAEIAVVVATVAAGAFRSATTGKAAQLNKDLLDVAVRDALAAAEGKVLGNLTDEEASTYAARARAAVLAAKKSGAVVSDKRSVPDQNGKNRPVPVWIAAPAVAEAPVPRNRDPEEHARVERQLAKFDELLASGMDPSQALAAVRAEAE